MLSNNYIRPYNANNVVRTSYGNYSRNNRYNYSNSSGRGGNDVARAATCRRGDDATRGGRGGGGGGEED